MIRDLNLDRMQESLIIGDVEAQDFSPIYRRMIRSEGGVFVADNQGQRVKFRLRVGLVNRLKDSAGWGSEDSFSAICICLVGVDEDLPECVALQFEGEPFFKIANQE